MKRLRRALGGIFSYQTKGGIRWGVDWTEPSGRERRKRGFVTRGKAEAFRDKVESRRQRNIPETVTLAHAIDAHRDARLEHGKKESSYQYLDAWAAALGELPLDAITAEAVDRQLRAWVTERKLSPATRNRMLAQLSAVLTTALRRRWIDRHPIRDSYVAPLPEPPGRQRWLSPDELAALLRKCEPWLSNIVRWAVATGWRLGEIVNLRVREVRQDASGKLYVDGGRTKDGTPLRWPLEGWPAKYAKGRMSADPDEYVLPGPLGWNARTSIKRSFRKAVVAAGLTWGRSTPDGVTFHTLRHSMASLALQAGLSERDIMTAGRWKDPRMVARYAHLADKRKRAVSAQVARLAGRPTRTLPVPEQIAGANRPKKAR